MRAFLWILTFAVLIIPIFLLLIWPDTYNNPVVAFLLSAALCAASVFASRQEFVTAANRATQTEWLSQAESACDRLLTTSAHVLRIKHRMTCTCDSALHQLPELATEELKPVRILLEAHCREAADNMLSIANHLESAISDWQRFIVKTCEGEECTRIRRNLEKRRADLSRDLPQEERSESISKPRATARAVQLDG